MNSRPTSIHEELPSQIDSAVWHLPSPDFQLLQEGRLGDSLFRIGSVDLYCRAAAAARQD